MDTTFPQQQANPLPLIYQPVRSEVNTQTEVKAKVESCYGQVQTVSVTAQSELPEYAVQYWCQLEVGTCIITSAMGPGVASIGKGQDFPRK